MAADKMNWVDLRRTIMARTGATEKEATAFQNALIESIKQGLRTDKQVRISGLGTFKLQVVAPRKSVNVVTGEEITIESYSKVIFVPESSVKESVSRGEMRVQKDPIEKLGQQADEILDILGEIGQGPRKAEDEQTTKSQEQPKTAESKAQSEGAEKEEKATGEETAKSEQDKKDEQDKKNERAALLTRIVDYTLLVLTLLVLTILGLRYHHDIAELAKKGYIKAQEMVEGLRTPATPADQEDVFPVVKDSVESVVPATAEEVTPATEVVAPATEVASTEEKIVEVNGSDVVYHKYIATETVRSGSRLTQIARRHYGKQELWVFICDANRDKIPNPDNLNAGIELRIPELTDELKDIDNPETKVLLQKLQQRCYANAPKKATKKTTKKRR